MLNLYEKIEGACKRAGLNITQLCKEAGVSRSSLSELKMGRIRSLTAANISAIATRLALPIEYFTDADSTALDDIEQNVKFALFGGDQEVTDEMYQEVLDFAKFVKEKYRRKE